MKVRIVIEPDEDVYVAYCPELPGCVTYGKTEEEARKNIMDAIELYLRPSKEELSKEAIRRKKGTVLFFIKNCTETSYG